MEQSPPDRPRLHVCVVGAGIMGAASALELLRDGHRVTLVEPGPPGGPQAASYGNAGWLSPSSVLPVSSPGLWRRVPFWLADPLGPLAIRWSYLPQAWPWLWRFLAAGATWDRVRTLSRALRPLVAQAPERHARLAQEAGVGDLIRKTGLLYVFPDRAAYAAEATGWAIRAEAGVRWLELDEDELRQREPALDRRYRFGAFVEDGGHCTDPGAYVAALVRHATDQGATLLQARATGFRLDGARLAAVVTDAGEVPCDRAVVATGAWSATLARMLGDRVVLESERGYHVVVTDPGDAAPRHPIMPSDGKMANTPQRGGLRLAGQVEIAGLARAPDWRRAAILRDHALRSYPGLPRDLPQDRVQVWMGHRPSTPDSLPVIGPASLCPDVVHCFGHGHIGLASGAVSGRLVADLISGTPPVIDPAPYAASRFNGSRGTPPRSR